MSQANPEGVTQREQQLVLQGFRAILGNLRVPYAACPITGGPRLFAWLETGANPGQRRDVTVANVRAARAEIERLRDATHGPVIDPTQIETTTPWAQSDFHTLWDEVFRRHVSSLILLPGWELSVGCLKEAKLAYQHGFPVVDRDLLPLAMSHLAGRVHQALEPLAAKGLPIAELNAELESFRALKEFV